MDLNTIAQYKTDERQTRRLAASGINNLVNSAKLRAEIASNPDYTDFWTDQNAKLPAEAQTALAQMETLVTQLHALMVGLHTAYAQIEPGGNLFPGIQPLDEIE